MEKEEPKQSVKKQLEPTPTVDNMINELSKKRQVSSWDIVKSLLNRHSEYGRNTARKIAEGEGPKSLKQQSVKHWIELIKELLDPIMISDLHGRLVILSLCRLDEKLANYLRSAGFLAAIDEELHEDFASLLKEEHAGDESYKGKFLKILQNKAKMFPELGTPRKTGFVVIFKGGPGLEPVARLCLGQKYNNSFTARYILPTGATFKDAFIDFIKDLQGLMIPGEDFVGDFFPDDKKYWESFLSPLHDVLKNIELKIFDQNFENNLSQFNNLVGKPGILIKRVRVVILVEYRGVDDDATLTKIGLTNTIVSQLHNLPERFGIVLSGLPGNILSQLQKDPFVQLEMPTDTQLWHGQALSNDIPQGPDRLNIVEEVHALAEAISLKDLTPPIVIGILGGWGAGKSFVLHLIEERLREIRCEKVKYFEEQVSGEDLNFPFIGHPYIIRFDAWTYAKSDLWASLMNCIFVELI